MLYSRIKYNDVFYSRIQHSVVNTMMYFSPSFFFITTLCCILEKIHHCICNTMLYSGIVYIIVFYSRIQQSVVNLSLKSTFRSIRVMLTKLCHFPIYLSKYEFLAREIIFRFWIKKVYF